MAKAPTRFDRALLVLTKGGVFTAEQICQEMKYDAAYRISAVILDAKLAAGAVIKTVRDGRKVTGYELVNVDEMKTYLNDKGFASFTPAKAPKTATTKVATVKPAKAPAKPKAEKTVKVKVNPTAQVALGAAPVVDVLDSIDTDITDFEDREFAQDFAEGKV